MKYGKHLACALLLALSFGAAAQDSRSTVESQAAQQMSQGTKLFESGQAAQAQPYFAKVAALYEQQYNQPGQRYYSARTQAERRAYLSEAARGKQSAQVTNSDWGYAYFLQGYILVDQNQFTPAKQMLQRAVALSPHNAQFRSELGHIYQNEKDWEQSLSAFKQAAEDASAYAPPETRNTELSRAWRGQAYTLVELNRLDEAEKLYHRCLALDKNDTKAAGELQYIRQVKAQRKQEI